MKIEYILFGPLILVCIWARSLSGRDRMSDTEHEYCKHGKCPKCEPCSLCEAAKAGAEAAREIFKELAEIDHFRSHK